MSNCISMIYINTVMIHIMMDLKKNTFIVILRHFFFSKGMGVG